MDITYKILWFEDTDESFETLSRRTTRYVEAKNLRCQITRIYGVSDFNISQYDLNSYEVLVVDLRLAQDSKGYEIIKTIRESHYVNDILFYSSEGIAALDAALKEYRLEGVFLSERDNRLFLEKIKQLIDKSVRRSENIINIRGIIMDETSEFDSQMKEIVIAAHSFMSQPEKESVKRHAIKLLTENAASARKLLEKYSADDNWMISNLMEEHAFTSMMKTRLLNKVLCMKENKRIQESIKACQDILPAVFDANGQIVNYVKEYEDKVLVFRNKLAHVKQINAEHPVLIGTVNGVEYKCDSSFCSMIRDTLIRYGKWFDALYDKLEKQINPNTL